MSCTRRAPPTFGGVRRIAHDLTDAHEGSQPIGNRHSRLSQPTGDDELGSETHGPEALGQMGRALHRETFARAQPGRKGIRALALKEGAGRSARQANSVAAQAIPASLMRYVSRPRQRAKLVR
jgi:hypothetical protein